MRVAESKHRRIGIMISAAGIPTFNTGVGTQLHHAEGEGRTWKRVAVGARADKGIDGGCELSRRSGYTACEQTRNQKGGS